MAAQGHRFDIVEDFGCIPATETSALSFIFIWVLPMIPCVVTSVYSCKFHEKSLFKITELTLHGHGQS